MQLHTSDILEIDLELTNACNLSCPLCARETNSVSLKYHKRTLDDWTNQIREYKNLEKVSLIGIISEPTLYKDFVPLVTWIKEQGLKIILNTNGNTHNVQWWKDLRGILDKDDDVLFTICGSTQKLHGHYRVGSNLAEVLRHHAAYGQGVLQYIRFEYNKDDTPPEGSIVINSLPYQERFDIDSDITLIDNLSKKYKLIKGINKKTKMQCKSFNTKYLSIDNFGDVHPCFLYRQYQKEEFNLDYTKIHNHEYDFCYECDAFTSKLLEEVGIETMV